jgi:S-adenosylmethionine uptake transporter
MQFKNILSSIQTVSAKNSMLAGVIWLLFNNLVLCLQSATIKGLSHSMPSFQVFFLYKLIVFIIVAIPLVGKGFFAKIKTDRLHLHFARAILSIGGGLSFVYAIGHMKLAHAVAICYTEPFFVVVLAIVLLKERVNIYNIIGLAIGFVGVMTVLRPNTTDFNIYALYIVGACLIWAFDNLVIKQLGKTEKSSQYLFYISFFSTVLSLPFALQNWVKVELWQLPWLFALASFYLFHLLAVFFAYQTTSLSNLMPFDFSKLVFSTSIGYLVFGELVDWWVIAGASLVILSNIFIIYNKSKLSTN